MHPHFRDAFHGDIAGRTFNMPLSFLTAYVLYKSCGGYKPAAPPERLYAPCGSGPVQDGFILTARPAFVNPKLQDKVTKLALKSRHIFSICPLPGPGERRKYPQNRGFEPGLMRARRAGCPRPGYFMAERLKGDARRLHEGCTALRPRTSGAPGEPAGFTPDRRRRSGWNPERPAVGGRIVFARRTGRVCGAAYNLL